MDYMSKSFLKSKTIWGAVIAVAPAVASMIGLSLSSADASEAVTHLDSIVTAVGGLIVIYGRVTATKAIGV